MFSLKGKKALVTGATGGIGADIARHLHAQGAVVSISGTNEEKLDSLSKELGNNVHKITCNLGNTEEVESLISKAIELMEGIDILVCNAGITRDTLAMRMKNEDWDIVLNVNLRSTFILNRNVLRHMLRTGGRIINIASVVASSGNPGQINYCASKAGMIGMSKALAKEVASKNITVNCVAPGFIETNMTDVLNEKQKEVILQNIPAKTMGKSADIAATVAFLASNEAKYITGQTIHVNGGLLMV
ncbi:MAG: 3-oxoacyl-[acyl-carrier-protein] reductase [Rickettsiales bacterium]|nr:3-oxoacyl-[acyl-carrier-protein] reductase [Rickettsiales bacterium]